MFGVAFNHFDANIAVIFGSYKLELPSKRGFPAFPPLQQTHITCAKSKCTRTWNLYLLGGKYRMILDKKIG